jgi:hypothetical protein
VRWKIGLLQNILTGGLIPACGYFPEAKIVSSQDVLGLYAKISEVRKYDLAENTKHCLRRK